MGISIFFVFKAPLFMSLLSNQNAAIVVTTPITITRGILAATTSPTGIPAPSAVSFGAPCMIKSPDNAIPVQIDSWPLPHPWPVTLH